MQISRPAASPNKKISGNFKKRSIFYKLNQFLHLRTKWMLVIGMVKCNCFVSCCRIVFRDKSIHSNQATASCIYALCIVFNFMHLELSCINVSHLEINELLMPTQITFLDRTTTWYLGPLVAKFTINFLDNLGRSI